MLEFALKNADRCLIKIVDNFFYFGNGDGGYFVASPDHVLRFVPYMKEPEEGEMIPDKVLDCIEKYADAAAPFVEAMDIIDTRVLDGSKGDPQEYLRRYKEMHPSRFKK